MMRFEIDKVDSFKMINMDTLETVVECDVDNMVAETYIDLYSLSKENLSFAYEATLDVKTTDYNTVLKDLTVSNDEPMYITYETPIMVQARWHKKKRINNKWLKRYGMKKDSVLIKCYVESIDSKPYEHYYEPSYLTEQHTEFNMTFKDMEIHFKPHQLRKGFRMDYCY